ncbi:MAG: hypothetical protein QOI21_567 [Actinomycetota bacterium]|jgi:hypothetical protein|nr:hypothetical protein [Actinomycetota bacterium]
MDMTHFNGSPGRTLNRSRLATTLGLACATTLLIGLISAPAANAVTPSVSLGSAATFAVLAGSTITNTGDTTINGDLGLSPGTAVTGFPPGQVNGAVHAADSVAAQAKSDLDAAYVDAEGRPSTATVAVELGGTTKTPGVYDSPAGTFGITGTLTLDAGGDPNAVFIFKAASTLITASASSVNLVNGARSSNVFWKVGSSATLGTYSVLRGTVMALASITVTTGVTVDGRTLARTAAVTLDSDTITRPVSTPQSVATTTKLTTSVNPSTLNQPVTFTAVVTSATGTAVPTGLVVFMDRWKLIGVVDLDSDGHAEFTTSTLTVDVHLIDAAYIPSSGFLSSTPPRVYQLVTST